MENKNQNLEEKVETEKKSNNESETEKETKKEDKKSQETKPKDKAIVRGRSLRVSSKHCFAICKILKGKTPDRAIEILEKVIEGKQPIIMKGEVAHKKGKGIAGAKFPKKASIAIIHLLKQLKANAMVNGIEHPVITIAKADKAPRQFRRWGRKAKRTHVYLEVKDRTKLIEK